MRFAHRHDRCRVGSTEQLQRRACTTAKFEREVCKMGKPHVVRRGQATGRDTTTRTNQSASPELGPI